MRKFLALLGLVIGGYIGFLNRPAALLVGQLPFEKIILAGTNLKGVEKLLAPTAQTSFQYMLVGAVLGLLGGVVIGSIAARLGKGK